MDLRQSGPAGIDSTGEENFDMNVIGMDITVRTSNASY